jgi:tetratricopeptide (TPR) repeat protein
VHAWDAQGALDPALSPLTRAAAAVSEYAPIHTALASDWLLLGFDGGAREEARRALDNASALPREQQLQAQGRYAETAADWPKAIETWRALRTFYPDRPDYTEHLANALTTSGKANEAIALLHSEK